MTVDELLAQLRDISEPVAPGWWPLALGWWYLLAGLVLLAMTIHFLVKRKAAYRPFVSAKAELQSFKALFINDKDTGKLAAALSQWLKRVSIFAFPEQQPAGLTGQAWLEFLDNSAGVTVFTDGPGQAFARSIYDDRIQLDGDQLLDVCERWLLAVKPHLIGQEIH